LLGPSPTDLGFTRDRIIEFASRPRPTCGGSPGQEKASLSQRKITPSRYAAGRHILVSRRGLDKGPIDDALELLGLQRQIITIVGGFASALGLARASDLIATVPERHTRTLRAGMHSFPLPVSLPEMTISMLWHPRLDADPAHRWLRGCVRDACKA
jgi:DNA-binding transcriptional LysR family regulator